MKKHRAKKKENSARWSYIKLVTFISSSIQLENVIENIPLTKDLIRDVYKVTFRL